MIACPLPLPHAELELGDTEPPPADDAITPERLIADRDKAERDVAHYLAGEDRFTSWGRA